MNIDLRPLTLADLAAIERIERRAYPTPWSRSMFAGEIAKQSSICLGAVDEDEGDRLVGYLIISRYADAWHIMNVAVDEAYRRRGIATMLLNRLFDRWRIACVPARSTSSKARNSCSHRESRYARRSRRGSCIR